MKRNLLAIMLAGALLAPAAAYAAPSGTGPEYTRAGHRLAECLYAKRKSDVLGMLAATSDGERARYESVLRNGNTCRNVTVSTAEIEGVAVNVPDDVLRGMLAEVVLDQSGKASALAPVTGGASYRRDWFAVTGRNAAVDEMAVCTAELNPAGVQGLLMTQPEGAEEMLAVQSLSATLGPCLPQGATLKANRQALRAALAEALYHRATTSALAAK